VCCSVLQCVAVCCGVLQCVTVCCSVLQCAAVCCSVLQYVEQCCSVLQIQICWRSIIFLVRNLLEIRDDSDIHRIEAIYEQ